MILSEKTVAILKNYASINQSILVRPGNTLRTVSPQKNVMSKVEVVENFTNEFGIYDLNKFLGVLSLFKDPALVFEDGFMRITDGKNSVKYVYADSSIIVAAPDKDVKLPSTDVSFDLTSDQLANVLKAAGVIGVPDITFRGDGSKIVMVAHDKKNTSSNEYAIEIGQTSETFSVDYKAENFKMISGDYKVDISKRLISSFEGESITYWVACESTSDFS